MCSGNGFSCWMGGTPQPSLVNGQQLCPIVDVTNGLLWQACPEAAHFLCRRAKVRSGWWAACRGRPGAWLIYLHLRRLYLGREGGRWGLQSW